MNLMISTAWLLPWRSLSQLLRQKSTGTTTIVMVKAALKFKKLAVLLFILWEGRTLELTFKMPMENQSKSLPSEETSTSIKLISLLLLGLASMEYLSSTLPLKGEIWHLEVISVAYPHRRPWRVMEQLQRWQQVRYAWTTAMVKEFTWTWEHAVDCSQRQSCQEWVKTFIGQVFQQRKEMEDISCIEDPVSDDEPLIYYEWIEYGYTYIQNQINKA